MPIGSWKARTAVLEEGGVAKERAAPAGDDAMVPEGHVLCGQISSDLICNGPPIW